MLVTTRTLDRGNVKSEHVILMAGAFNMNWAVVSDCNTWKGGETYVVHDIGGKQHKRHPAGCRLGRLRRTSLAESKGFLRMAPWPWRFQTSLLVSTQHR